MSAPNVVGRLTPERLGEIRELASNTSSTVFARALNNLLAHLDAVTGERDEARAVLAKIGAEPFIAAAIRAVFPEAPR